MKYSFHPLAIEELNNSIDYYENKNSGLGLVFCRENEKKKLLKRVYKNVLPFSVSLYLSFDSSIKLASINSLILLRILNKGTLI